MAPWSKRGSWGSCGRETRVQVLLNIDGITPERRDQIARFGVQVVLAAILANLMSGAIAGYSSEKEDLWDVERRSSSSTA